MLKTFYYNFVTTEDPIFEAIRTKKVDVFKTKLTRESLRQYSRQGDSPLMLAVRLNQEETVEEIVEQYSSNESDAEHLHFRHRDTGQTALMIAAELGHDRLLPHLLKRDRTNEMNLVDHMSNTAVHYAALSNNMDSVKALLRLNEIVMYSLDIDQKMTYSPPQRPRVGIMNREGKKPMDLTTDPEIKKLLKQRMLDDELIIAIDDLNENGIINAIRNGANPQYRNRFGATVLDLAVSKLREDEPWEEISKIISVLIKSDPKPDFEGGNLGPILIWAIHYHDDFLVKELLNEGANPNAHDKNAISALEIVLHLRKKEIAKLLLKYGADPNLLGMDQFIKFPECFHLWEALSQNRIEGLKPNPTINLLWKDGFEELSNSNPSKDKMSKKSMLM